MGSIKLFGSDTLEYQYSPQKTIYEKFSEFAPVYAPVTGYQLDYSYAPSMFIDSPGSRGAVVTTKKQMTQTPDITGATLEQSPIVSPSQVGPTSDPMGMILILGLVAVGGYVAVNLLKKKTQKDKK